MVKVRIQMKKILIWKKLNYEIDIYQKTDVKNVYLEIKKNGNKCPNWGNKVWYQAILSEISTTENEIIIRTNQTYEEINRQYDLIIYPMANTFGKKYQAILEELSLVFSKIKIPVYVIACGVQTTDTTLNDLVDTIGEASKRFISSIYETGGEFALRGYITKEYFDKLGFPSAVVTGCPSLYQIGRKLQITNRRVEREEFYSVFNGKFIAPFENAINFYQNSVFIDQNDFFVPLSDSNFRINGLKEQIKFCLNYGQNVAKYLSEGRILMFPDVNEWRNYLINSGINYSFGSRIHGSIMAILSGIPATVVGLDCRVIEMAEFFDIPLWPLKDNYTPDEIYEAYCMADYNKFNLHFEERYNAFEKFMKNCGITNQINENNPFFRFTDSKCTQEWVDYQNLEKIYQQMKENRFSINMGIKAAKFLNSIKDIKNG